MIFTISSPMPGIFEKAWCPTQNGVLYSEDNLFQHSRSGTWTWFLYLVLVQSYWIFWIEHLKSILTIFIEYRQLSSIYWYLLDSTVHINPMKFNFKLEKFKRGRSLSLHLTKEGDLAWNNSSTLILSINIQIPAEIVKIMRYSLLKMA